MATKLDSLCRTCGVNLYNVSRDTGIDLSEVHSILEGRKIPTRHKLNVLMDGISKATKKRFTDQQSIDLLSESDGALLNEVMKPATRW